MSQPVVAAKADRLLLASFNVNGIRAAMRRGLAGWIAEAGPDILCLQEIRISASQLSTAVVLPRGYYCYWHHAERPGYSGTALLSRVKPESVRFGISAHVADCEGRTVVAEYPGFTLINCYCPSGNRNPERLAYKLAFYETVLSACRLLLRDGKHLILCGDVNTAHQRIDLANPDANARTPGFLPEERLWMDRLVQAGFVDTFRYFSPGVPHQYTW
jgi:exodeoxyribonuclease III